MNFVDLLSRCHLTEISECFGLLIYLYTCSIFERFLNIKNSKKIYTHISTCTADMWLCLNIFDVYIIYIISYSRNTLPYDRILRKISLIGLMSWRWTLLAGSGADCGACVVMLAIMLRLDRRQKAAYKGDRTAIDHLVLPCFIPIFKGIIVEFAVLSVVFAALASVSFLSSEAFFRMTQYKLFLSCFAFAIAPVLMTQKCISATSMKRVFIRISPWFMVGTVMCALSAAVPGGGAEVGVQICFLIVGSVFPLIFCLLLSLKIVWCRVQFASASNRSSIQHLFLFSLLYALFNMCFILRNHDEAYDTTALALTVCLYMSIVVYPTSLYRTFLADTKFWRGLGRHNRGGIRKSTSPSNIRSIAALPKIGYTSDRGSADFDGTGNIRESEMNLSTASNQFQDMMNDISEVMIDFAYIELGPVIGHGASAEVLFGKYQNNEVAIKVSAPPEITEEVLDSLNAEAAVTSSLDHPNIIKFYGICVRPPEIGMVIEFCSRGNLKVRLLKESSEWTSKRRILAALQAARAVEYLHSKSIIHRDIKADNFFVDEKWNVKLGDFGESAFKQQYEPGRRMTVLGTVAFMAPELVEGRPVYTESIDVYALGITMWEIWTGQDPFDETATFSIYSKVMSGERPPVPNTAPDSYVDLMCRAWNQDPGNRPTATEMVQELELAISSGSYSKTPKLGQNSDFSVNHSVNDINENSVEMSSNPILYKN